MTRQIQSRSGSIFLLRQGATEDKAPVPFVELELELVLDL
jgi:hypothetical protein